MAARVLNGLRITRCSTAFLGAFAFCLAVWAHAVTTTMTVEDTVKGTSSSPVTMLFPVTRSGDTSYDAVLSYHTVNGTAVAPLDYLSSVSNIVIPAGSTSASVPITVSAYPYGGPDRTFQLLLDAATGIGPTPTFATQQTFGAGLAPHSVIAADVNGDGKPDLIVANYNDSTLSVLLNTTAPGAAASSFASQQTFATGASPSSVTVADVNGDGKPDLVLTNNFDSTISVLLNTTVTGATMPSFAARQTFATGFQPRCVVASDLNGDGKLDLVVANLGSNTISVLLNTTDPGAAIPSFASQQSFATGTNPASVTVADFNGDGIPDVAAANLFSASVSVLLNTTVAGATTPSFATQKLFVAGASPISVTTGDVDGDGKPDMIVTNNSGIAVLINTTATGAAVSSFTAQQTFATGDFPVSVVTTDVNGDGKIDLIVVNKGPSTIPDYGTVSVLLNTTAPGVQMPNFAGQQQFATGQGSISVATADLNGDGKVDVVVANEDSNDVSVLLNTTAPPTDAFNLAAEQNFATGNFSFSVTSADINGDGKRDLIVTNGTDNTVSVLLNNSAPGAITPTFASQQTFATGVAPFSVTSADVNGDGKPDLIVANQGTSASVLLNTTAPGATTPSFAPQQSFATGATSVSVVATDINGDGRPDLVVANRGGNSVSVLLNDTAPGATSPSFALQQTFATGTTPFCVTTADINGDGKPDLIVANNFDNAVSVLLNTTTPGAGAPSFAQQQTFATGLHPFSVASSDINGDGKPDLIVANNSDNQVSVLLNTTAPGAATPSFAAQQGFATGTGPVSVTTGDVDGDGKLDLVVANQFSNTVSVLLNTSVPGTSMPSFAAQQTFAAGPIPTWVAITDINGDGRLDLIAANRDSNSVSVLLNTQYQTLFAGSPATGTIVHDYIFANGFE